MADIREKMIELLRKTRYEYRHYISVKDYEKRIAKTEEEFLAIDDSIVGEIPFCADYLLSNGVTIATDNNVRHKWISVKERLPDDWVLCACVDNEVHILCYDYIMDDWDIWGRPNSCYGKPFVTHWMPLPEPPKGE